MSAILIDTTKELFSCDYDSVSDDQYDVMVDQAERLVKDYGWNAVFEAWSSYLYENCTTYEQALNFAHWFFGYGGCEQKIENPYHFLGYFYYRIDMNEHGEEAMTIMDTITIEVLSRAGYKKEVGWGENPRYVPELDPKMVASVEEWKQKTFS